MTMAPTQAGFLDWVRTQMGISTVELPDSSPWIGYAYNVALEITNLYFAQASPTLYTLAVYNLGGDNLINYAPDQPGSTFFADLRASFTINSFTPGVVSSSSDAGTSTSLLNPDFMKELTLANLQNLKTPYGRRYLSIAQSFGPLWGLS
jgi:hypothetical protein